MKTFSFYDPATGLLSGGNVTLPEGLLELNTPEGLVAIEGVFDPARQRIDLATGKAVDWQPPVDPQRAAAHRHFERERLVRQMEGQQARSMRALLLDPNDQQARQRLAEIEAQIAATGIRGPTERS